MLFFVFEFARNPTRTHLDLNNNVAMETEHWSYRPSGITLGLPPSPSKINWLRKFKEKNTQIRTYKSTQHVGPELPPEQEEIHKSRLRQCKEKKRSGIVFFIFHLSNCVLFLCHVSLLCKLAFPFFVELEKVLLSTVLPAYN